jgi:hypothetical protein
MNSCGGLLLIGMAFPEILEAATELAAPQGDDGVCAPYRPVHARSLEPGANHYFTAGFHHAGRSAETLLVQLRISHALSIIPNVADTISRLFALASMAMQRFD